MIGHVNKVNNVFHKVETMYFMRVNNVWGQEVSRPSIRNTLRV